MTFPACGREKAVALQETCDVGSGEDGFNVPFVSLDKERGLHE